MYFLSYSLPHDEKLTLLSCHLNERQLISPETIFNQLILKRSNRSLLYLSDHVQDPAKNGVLAVQTIRNNIMASTLMATTTITIGSLISVFVSSTSSTGKYRYIVLCFLVAFLCNVQSIRYYAHASFLVSLPAGEGRKDYLAAILNRGSLFWSLGLRAFYFAIPLFLWIFGPLSMFASCYLITFVLYFLDFTGTSSYDPYEYMQKEETNNNDIESVGQSRRVLSYA